MKPLFAAKEVMRRAYSLVLVLAFAPAVAFANPENPATIRSTLGLDQFPPCTICHSEAVGAKGTATKPLARTLSQLGVTGTSGPGAFKDALGRMETCGIDSDGDGVSDVDELVAGADPNDGNGSPTSMCSDEVIVDTTNVPLPQHGCSLAASRRTIIGGTVALYFSSGLAMVALLWRRARSMRSNTVTQ
ncbi:MAG TPA: thrombospondin type 3 repeat-containing protein [Polyangiaceae bacterium]|nr:thrombospondin type 3 repeat-containing protein [Polyangiaceae bacterium]